MPRGGRKEGVRPATKHKETRVPPIGPSVLSDNVVVAMQRVLGSYDPHHSVDPERGIVPIDETPKRLQDVFLQLGVKGHAGFVKTAAAFVGNLNVSQGMVGLVENLLQVPGVRERIQSTGRDVFGDPVLRVREYMTDPEQHREAIHADLRKIVTASRKREPLKAEDMQTLEEQAHAKPHEGRRILRLLAITAGLAYKKTRVPTAAIVIGTEVVKHLHGPMHEVMRLEGLQALVTDMMSTDTTQNQNYSPEQVDAMVRVLADFARHREGLLRRRQRELTILARANGRNEGVLRRHHSKGAPTETDATDLGPIGSLRELTGIGQGLEAALRTAVQKRTSAGKR